MSSIVSITFLTELVRVSATRKYCHQLKKWEEATAHFQLNSKRWTSIINTNIHAVADKTTRCSSNKRKEKETKETKFGSRWTTENENNNETDSDNGNPIGLSRIWKVVKDKCDRTSPALAPHQANEAETVHFRFSKNIWYIYVYLIFGTVITADNSPSWHLSVAWRPIIELVNQIKLIVAAS